MAMATTATLLQGIGEVDDAEVEELKILAEVVSGRPPRPIKLRVFALRSAERTGKQVWAEQVLSPLAVELGCEGEGERPSFTIFSSGWMRSAARVRDNLGHMRSLHKTVVDCSSRAEFLADRLPKLRLAVEHDYVKEGFAFDVASRGRESLLADEAENKCALTLRVVELKVCEEVEGADLEEAAFPGKWLVELVATARGADYTQAVMDFEDFARKLSPIVKFADPSSVTKCNKRARQR